MSCLRPKGTLTLTPGWMQAIEAGTR
jgi:hypothetical protein